MLFFFLNDTFAKVIKKRKNERQMNRLLLDVLDGQQTERPPVWLMRQAGRILPQYRAVRAGLSSFKELVKNTDKAAEVTIQPVDELGVDAAIVFSDILVIPEAMGLDYELVKNTGPVFSRVIENEKDIDQMGEGDAAAEKIDYVYDVIQEINKRLENRVPLIGFCGAPWTLFCYMLEGHGSKTFSKARRFLYQHPEQSKRLLDKITSVTIAYLTRQIQSGVDVVQIFDSWAGVLGHEKYNEFGLTYIRRILEGLPEGTRSIVFSKGAYSSLDQLIDLPCTALSFDWMRTATELTQKIGHKKVIQGNLDPCVLYGAPEVIEAETKQILSAFDRGHIMNLGHGVYPDTPLEGVRHFVNTVKSYRYDSI